MTDMQTSLPLLIVRSFILNPVTHFSTQPLTGEMKCPTSYTFVLCIPFHLLKCWCHTSTNLHQAFWSSSWVNTWLDLRWMIWSTSHHHVTYWFIGLNLTFSSPLPWSIGAKSLLNLPRHMRFVASKPPTCPSHLQPVHWRKALSWSSPSSHTTPYHVSYAMSSFITLYEHSINP